MTTRAIQQFQLRTVIGTEEKAKETLRLMEESGYDGIEAVVLESHKNWAEKSPIKSFQLSADFLNSHFSDTL